MEIKHKELLLFGCKTTNTICVNAWRSTLGILKIFIFMRFLLVSVSFGRVISNSSGAIQDSSLIDVNLYVLDWTILHPFSDDN